jgi:hypothetical protein
MQSRRRPQATPFTTLAVILLAGAVIRLVGIADRGLWLDEALSVLYAHLDWGAVIALRRYGTNPPLYHFLLSLWVGVFGDSEFSVRMLSWVFGVGSVWAVYELARRLADVPTALIAAAVLAVSDMAVAYSQEARFYAMIQFGSIASTLALYTWVVDRSPRAGWAYVAAMILFAWTHTYAWFVLAAHAVWIVGRASLFNRERQRLLRGGGLGFAVIVASFVPWILVLVDQVRTASGHYWIPRPPAWLLPACLYDFVAPVHFLRYLVGVAAIIVVLGWVLTRRRRAAARVNHEPQHPVAYGLLLCWLALPVLMPFLWSLVGTPIFQIKYAIVAQPAAVILLARLAARATVAGMGIVTLVSFWSFWPAGYPLVYEDWDKAANLIEREQGRGALIYVYRDYCTPALSYYLSGNDSVVPVRARDQGRTHFEPYHPNPSIGFDDLLQALRNATGEAWVVLARVRLTEDPQAFERLYAELTRAGSLADHWKLTCIDLLRFGPTEGRAPPRPELPGPFDDTGTP